MSITSQDLASALMGKLQEILSQGGLADNAFLSVVNGGLLLDRSNFDFMTDGSGGSDGGGGGAFGDNPFGGSDDDSGGSSSGATSNVARDHHRDISRICNTIPENGGAWASSGLSVDQLYGDWLSLAKVPEQPLTDAQQKELAAAEKTIEKYGHDYFKYKISYQNASSAVASAKLDGANPITLRKLQQAEETQLQAFQALGHQQEFEKAMATQRNLLQTGYAGQMKKLSDTFTNEKNNHVDSEGDGFLPVRLLPGSFLESGELWNEYSLSSKEVEHYKSLHDTTWSAGATFPLEDFFWAGGGTSGEKRTYVSDVSMDDFSISFQFARVLIDRSSWFDGTLLTSRSWWWPDATKSKPLGTGTLYSNGNAPQSNPGQWVLTPLEVIFVKNLEIDVHTSDDDTIKKLTKIHEEVSAGFLFFHLGGEDYTSTKESTRHTFRSSHGKISAPSMQIAAFVCQTMPKEPNPVPSNLPG